MSQKTAASAERGDPPTARARARRGVAYWLGLVLVLGGLSMLGYVGWQMVGTNVVARQTQERIVEDLEREWAAPRKDTGPVGDASAVIRIPAFGKDYAVPVLEGIGDKELSSGYGHFPGTADPGERGNYALAAHRVTHGEPLRDMPKLRPGDEIIVETREAIHTYVLDTNPNHLIVTFEDIWVVDRRPRNPDGGVEPPRDSNRLITLTTCSELFHTDNRMIAFGHLVRTEHK